MKVFCVMGWTSSELLTVELTSALAIDECHIIWWQHAPTIWLACAAIYSTCRPVLYSSLSTRVAAMIDKIVRAQKVSVLFFSNPYRYTCTIKLSFAYSSFLAHCRAVHTWLVRHVTNIDKDTAIAGTFRHTHTITPIGDVMSPIAIIIGINHFSGRRHQSLMPSP